MSIQFLAFKKVVNVYIYIYIYRERERERGRERERERKREREDKFASGWNATYMYTQIL